MNHTMVAQTYTPTQLYWHGFHAYMDGKQLEQMKCESERKGWWAALDAHAQAEVAELVDDRMDREWWGRGGW